MAMVVQESDQGVESDTNGKKRRWASIEIKKEKRQTEEC
jgi:hypothetical protein